MGATAAVLAVTQVCAGDDGGHIVLQWFKMKWKNEKEKRKTYLGGVKWVGCRVSVHKWQAWEGR